MNLANDAGNSRVGVHTRSCVQYALSNRECPA
jgi:hypothetical protein